MKKMILAGVLSLVATGAFAQYDHRDGDRDRDRHGFPGRIIGHTLGAIEGRSIHRDCRVVVQRRVRPDGDVVISRRRMCD
jgi:hypothetical protein